MNQMETPYIHIKFVPLIKMLVKNNSHYNLKITPVPCVEYINKIKLKDVKDKVECTVPILYKIVIMKTSPRKKCIRIYHSCVDIVTSTSLLTLGLSAGDVQKSLSDYSILSKRNKSSEFENIPTCDVKFHTKLNLINKTDIFYKAERKKLNPYKIHNSELSPLSYYENLKLLQKNVNNQVFGKDFNYSKTSNFEQFERNEDNINKYEFHYLQSLANKMKSLESNTNRSRMPRTNIEEKKLIKTDYSRNIEHRMKSTINVTPILAGNLIINSLNDYSIINTIDRDIQDKINYPERFNPSFTKFHARILPEIRVANFVKNMEMEIRPLKIILNDIIKKCIASNLYTLLKFKSPVNKNTTDHDKHSCDVENNKTNRVVYSIVFHE